jgi:S-(hydroxymethyl)glutathione dehydrogenase / alcohol dehydrogenase
MRAAVFREVGTPMEIEDVVVDEPAGNEVLLRTVATGLCHSDLHCIQGSFDVEIPIVLGHEASGIVEKVGSQVSGLEVGDHVIVFCAPACGRCPACYAGRPTICHNPPFTRADGQPPRLVVNGEPVGALSGLGTFAEQMLVAETSVVKIRKDMPLDKAALISCAVITGIGAAAFTARVGLGDDVAVIGAGGVGLNAVQGARLAGARRVIAIDRLQSNLQLAKKFGATHLIDAGAVDAVAGVLDLTGDGVDHAIEAVGVAKTAEQAFAMLRHGGTATVIGMIPADQPISLPGLALLDERRLQGSHMGSARYQIHLPMLVDLYLDGRLELDSLVAESIELADINAGYDELSRGRLARSIIVFDEAP